jgi:L-cystine transport system permease protein
MYAVLLTLALGLVAGTLTAIIQNFKVPVASQLITFIFTIIRGTPSVLTIMLVRLVYTLRFASVAAFFHLKITIRDVDPIYSGILAMFIFILPILSAAMGGALSSVGRDQYEAAYSVGLTFFQAFRRIVIPQMIPVAVPVLVNTFIILLKVSALLFMIGITDIYNGSLLPSHITYGYLEGYIAAGVIYWLIFFVVEQAGAYLEKRISRKVFPGAVISKGSLPLRGSEKAV